MTANKSKMSVLDATNEVNLQDLLSEPIVRALMDRDGVTSPDLTDLFHTVRKQIIADRWRQAA